VEGNCLMTNKVHIVGTPYAGDSLERDSRRMPFLYIRCSNRIPHSGGPSRRHFFYARATNKEAFGHVEVNPVQAGNETNGRLSPTSPAT